MKEDGQKKSIIISWRNSTIWDKLEEVKTMIGARTSIQVRSHAQKFYYKMKTCKDGKLGIDLTSNSICNIRDMISQIKNNNSNYNINDIFKYLAYKWATNK